MDLTEETKAFYYILAKYAGETFTFERAGHTFTRKVAEYPVETIVRLVLHGAKQKEGDAAAGKTGAEARKAVDKAHASLLAGEWTDKATALFAMCRVIIGSAIKGDVPAIRTAADLETVCKAHGITAAKVTAKALGALKAKEVSDLDTLK